MNNAHPKNVMLFYPPGKVYQRGEDRCQGNIEESAATSMRACNDLGYVASGLKGLPYNVLLKDYPAEGGKKTDLFRDVREFSPDLVFVSVTSATLFDDLEIIFEIKKLKPNVDVVLKGAVFFDPSENRLDRLDLSSVDYLIGGESDFVAARLIHRHFRGKSVKDLPGVLYKLGGAWIKTDFSYFEDNLDCLRFPDRSRMNNRLYTRPDTGEPQATISVSRGCPSSCIYCLTPVISGKKLRQRSPENVLAEMRECYHTFGVRHFFMKSDTFTLAPEWVKRLCGLILRSELHPWISWVANSRTHPISFETLMTMKEAGCWLVAFGFESGSAESLCRMRKGATVEHSLRAAKLARKAGLGIFGFYMAGFPWETRKHLNETEDLIFNIDADFIEIHIPVPYEGTELKKMCMDCGMDNSDELGKDYFGNPVANAGTLAIEDIVRFRKRVLLRYYFRVPYILRRLNDIRENPGVLIRYGRYALRLVRNLL